MSHVASIFLALFIILCSSLIIITLGLIWLITSYYAKKKGYDKASARRTLEQLRNDISLIRSDINDMKAYIADLTIKAHDEMRLRQSYRTYANINKTIDKSI
ncbi:hypothetical protein FJZ31_42910 [Candidatus Poribacteria bacterium]|nr:hypothetical protein [Candidatus Poribacteria bacterium]